MAGPQRGLITRHGRVGLGGKMAGSRPAIRPEKSPAPRLSREDHAKVTEGTGLSNLERETRFELATLTLAT